MVPRPIRYVDMAEPLKPEWFACWPDGKGIPLRGLLDALNLSLADFILDTIDSFGDPDHLLAFVANWQPAIELPQFCRSYERTKIASTVCVRVAELNAKG